MLTNLDNPERLARNYRGEVCRMPTPSRSHLVAAYGAGMVELWRRGQAFSVVYGLSCKEGLSYAQAAHEVGECLMHFLQCEGLLE